MTMSAAELSGTITPPLNVGVYGNTRAGKTRFLYELISGWHRNFRIVESSEQTTAFLQEIEPDIRAYQHSRGTVKTIENIQVLVQRGENQAPWNLTFRDLRGEFLAHEVDDLRRVGKQASIPRQVRECNSFVFFFDPTSEDAPEQIEAHHTRELRRAERFIDYVLAERQNRYLPILFVLTRLDRWEANHDLRKRIGDWIGRVNQKLKTAYRRALGGHFPQRLVDPMATTLCISSVRENQAEQVVDRLGELVQECAEFNQRDRRHLRSVLGSLILTLGLFAVLVLGIFWWVGGDGKPQLPKQPRTTVQEWTADEVRTQLAGLDRVLAAHPRGRTLPTLDDARALNTFLRWLPAKLEFTRNDANFPAGVRREMETALERLVNTIQLKLDAPPGEPVDPRWKVIVAYLEDVPPAVDQPALEQLRGDAWALGRQRLVRQLAEILRRRERVDSPPQDAILEILSTLRHEEQEIQSVRIGGLKAQEALLSELRTTATFLEVRKNTRMMTARFQLTSARLIGVNVSQTERGLQLLSPGKALPKYILLQPSRVDAREVKFTTLQPNYPVEIGLGSPVTLRLAIWNEPAGDFDTLKDFDLAAPGQAGPLAPLGLPLLVLGQTRVQKQLEWQGYELKFDWLDLPRAPGLLEAAASQVAGDTSP